MSGQKRHHSLLETITSTLTGLAFSIALQATIYPLYGFNPSLSTNAQIAAIFTVASILRGYCLRRAFNKLQKANT